MVGEARRLNGGLIAETCQGLLGNGYVSNEAKLRIR